MSRLELKSISVETKKIRKIEKLSNHFDGAIKAQNRFNDRVDKHKEAMNCLE